MADKLDAVVRWVWALSAAVQAVLCVVLFLKGNFRRIPIFTCYAVANLFQAIVLYVVYYRMGFRTLNAVIFAWSTQACIQILRAAATTEVLRVVLKPYRGIWGLAWRLLAAAFFVIFAIALIDSGRNLTWVVVLADRGFHLAFGIALVACLLLAHYYSIPVHPVYKSLLGGFCFYSCTVVLANTLGGALFVHGNANFQRTWQLVTMLAFVAVVSVWANALRRPLPESKQDLGPKGTAPSYWEMSTQINERLRLLNDQLGRLWKLEVTRQ